MLKAEENVKLLTNKQFLENSKIARTNLNLFLPHFKKYIDIYVNSLELSDILLINEKIPKLLTRDDTDLEKQNLKHLFKQIICAINPHDDGSSIAIGIEMCIKLQYSSMQKILDVKQLKNNQNNKYEQIIPILDCTLLYKHCDIFWVRINVENEENLKQIKNHFKKYEEYKHYFIFPNTYVVEFYFKTKTKSKTKLQIVDDFLELGFDIIFFSDCRFLKNIVPHCAFVSNVMKMYFCYILKKIIFTVDNKHEYDILNICLILALHFIEKDNLKTFKNDNFVTPMSFLSSVNPINNLLRLTKQQIKDETNEDVEENCDLRDTCFDENNKTVKYKVYDFCNDRDYRIFGINSRVGGNSVHELQLL